jgi:hypothetical protein
MVYVNFSVAGIRKFSYLLKSTGCPKKKKSSLLFFFLGYTDFIPAASKGGRRAFSECRLLRLVL